MLGERHLDLLTGAAQFTEDLVPADSLRAVLLRAPVGHGRITALDLSAARAAPGVRAVYDAGDLAAGGVKPMRSRAPVTGDDGQPMRQPERPVLAIDSVKYLGQPIAVVIADSQAAAEDARDLIDLGIEEAPVINSAEAAAAEDATQLWPTAPGNQSFIWRAGTPAAVETAMADAAHVVTLTVRHPRRAISPVENRSCVGCYDPTSGRFTLTTPSQGVVSLRAALAEVLSVDEALMRVTTPHVGGSFAVKIWPYPEQALCLFAARALGRPVAWIGSRDEAFVGDAHGRGRVDRARLALNAEGRFLAFEIDALADMGAYLSAVAPSIVTAGAVRVFGQCYDIPAMHYQVRAMFTNGVPTDAYRGAGKPESAATLERLIDLAADQLGLDRADIRRRNLIQPTALPHHTAMGEEIDSGDFPGLFEDTLARADWTGFAARRAASQAAGRLRGIAVASHMHATGGSTAERSTVRVEADGTVTVDTGAQDSGQSHGDTLAKVAAEALEISADSVTVREGDSDRLEIGGGTGGSCLMPISANTVHRAAVSMIENARAGASHLLEAAAQDLEYAGGNFTVVGTDRRISLAEIATRWPEIPADQLPPGATAGCVASEDFTGRHTTFPNGCYVVEVEVDPATGETRVDRFTGTDDLGRIINAEAARGQILGGLGQAIGEVLMEAVIYDDGGQMINGSLLDYPLPRADQMPDFDLAWRPTASPHSLLDVKGVGELSSIGAPGPLANAIHDALREAGVEHLDMPLGPHKLWRAIHGPDTALGDNR